MKFLCRVHQSMYEHNDKKYMRILLARTSSEIIQRMHDKNIHRLSNSIVDNPLDGKILTIKIPFRYRRVMCKVIGSKPVQSLVTNDEIEVDISFKGVWNIGNHSGYSWVVDSINSFQ